MLFEAGEALLNVSASVLLLSIGNESRAHVGGGHTSLGEILEDCRVDGTEVVWTEHTVRFGCGTHICYVTRRQCKDSVVTFL